MRVLHMDLGREMRGGQRQVYYLVRGLAEEGFVAPTVACVKDSPLHDALVDVGIPVVALNGLKEWNPFVFFRAAQANKSGHFEVIHTHDARAASLGALLRGSCMKGAKLVHTRRTILPMRRGWSRKKYLNAEAVVCVSHGVAAAMRDSGMPEEKLLVIPSAIDPKRYTSKVERNDGRIVFGMVGALTPEKGHALFLEALGLLHALNALPPWEARFAGSGPLLPQLLKKGEDLGILEHLSFLGWQESCNVLPQCDVLVVPSIEREASSGAIREGWVVGLPVVCSDLPGNTELIKDGENGLVFANLSAESLAGKLLKILHEPEIVMHLVAGGRSSLEPFLVSSMIRGYTELYTRLLA